MPAKTPAKKRFGSAARMRHYAPSPSPSPSRWSPPRFGRSTARSPKKAKKRTRSAPKKTKPATKAGRGKRSRSKSKSKSRSAAKRPPARHDASASFHYDSPASFRCPCTGMY